MNKITKIGILFFVICTVQLNAQTISNHRKSIVLDSLINIIERVYPFKSIAARTVDALEIQISKGVYDKYKTPNGFATKVTNSLEEFSKDKHLDLIYNPKMAKVLLEDTTFNNLLYTHEEAKIEIWNNYGFRELSILNGNIGYLNLTVFFSTAYAGKMADVAMSYFSNSNALIIDLRENGGGWGDMVDYLLGYFIDNSDPLLLTINESTIDGSLFAEVIPQYVPGKKLTDIPIYILTSETTASAAEAFTSHLKYFNDNVIIVGQKTRGAENPITDIAIDENFILQIPGIKKTYSRNPNVWEGVGIDPDFDVGTKDAKRIAHLNALEKLNISTNDKVAKQNYQWAIDGLHASYKNVDSEKLKKYAGKYDNVEIFFTDNKMYYQYKQRSAVLMIPISDNYFVLEGTKHYRLKFILTDETMTMKKIYANGIVKDILRVNEKLQ